jgi:hypothetical protein
VVGTPFVMPAPPASYQWQKAEAECPVPPGRVESVALEFAGTGPSLMQFTGAFLGPVPAAATPSPRSRGDQGQ